MDPAERFQTAYFLAIIPNEYKLALGGFVCTFLDRLACYFVHSKEMTDCDRLEHDISWDLFQYFFWCLSYECCL